MVEFKSISGEFDSTKNTLKSSCKLKLADSLTAKLKLGSPGNKLAYEIEGKTWQVSYDAKTKDVELERKWKLKAGELKIKQKIPNGKTFLVPSPEVQWKSHVVKNKKVAWEVQPSYCFQTRRGKLEQTLELGGRHKLKLEADSKTALSGAVATLTTKPSAPWAKAVSVKATGSGAVSLIHEVEQGKKVSLKSTLGLRSRDLKLVAEVKPGVKVAGLKPKLTLEGRVTAPKTGGLRPGGFVAGLALEH